MHQIFEEFSVRTDGPGLYEITAEVRDWLASGGIADGLLTLHVRHTSASIVIQENADPDVRTDLEAFFRRLVPPGDPLFRHPCEGPDDMAAHVRSALTSTTLSVPVRGGEPQLGTWQGIYVFEHRDAPHRRLVAAHAIGD